jgi:superfamily II DNA or RNA helicase
LKPRPYQLEAKSAIFKAWEAAQSTLAVLATGLGKTVLFSDIAHAMDHGRVLVIAHREELIFQAAHKLQAITGEAPEIEMAEMYAGQTMFSSRCVVASVQTLNATRSGKPRYERFKPSDFCLVVVDEAHHATADSYRRVLNYFKQNPACKILGVTATPDRADKVAMGAVFESVAFKYDIVQGIADGWLCPLEQRFILAQSIDLSNVPLNKSGDFSGVDLGKTLEEEKAVHELAYPMFKIAEGRKTLVFAASVAHAKLMAEILNRWQGDCARWVSGETPDVERKTILADFAAGKFHMLCNVGVFTEGFDEPGIRVVGIARPTKSRSLYVQMVGRGTRTLPNTVEGLDDPVERIERIAMSPKPCVIIADLVGCAGKHKLVTCVDILAGEEPEEVVEAAKELIQKESKAGRAMDANQALSEAKENKRKEREQQEQRERQAKAHLKFEVGFVQEVVDPFNIDGEVGIDRAHVPRGPKPLTPRMIEFLEEQGYENPSKMSFTQAGALIGDIKKRLESGQCSPKQANTLAKYGYSRTLTKAEAKVILDQLAANGWKALPRTQAQAPAQAPQPAQAMALTAEVMESF